MDRCKQHLDTLDKDTLVIYWHIGDELVKDGYDPKKEQWNGKKTKGMVSILAKTINRSLTTIREAYLLRVNYADLHNAIVKVKSWYQWVNRYTTNKVTKPFDYQLYNVWKTFKLNLNFGKRYLGETPPELIANLLYYYTKEGDYVLDPMAGGGVTIDVCKTMNRNCIAFDISPTREDIQQNDIIVKLPVDYKVNFIFLDPPYYKQNAYEDCAFTKSLTEFYQAMNTTLNRCYQALEADGFLALLLKPMGLRESGDFEWEDLTLKCHALAEKIGFKLVKRIVAPLSTQQYTPEDVARAKKGCYMLNTLRDLVVYQK